MKKEKIVTWIMVVLLTFYQIGIQTCAKENVALNNVCDENLISTEVREYFDENYQGLLKCFAQEHYNTNDLSAFVVEQPFIIYHYNLLENYILYFPISFKNRIIAVMDMIYSEGKYSLGLSEEYIQYLNEINYIESPAILYCYEDNLYIENKKKQIKTNYSCSNILTNDSKKDLQIFYDFDFETKQTLIKNAIIRRFNTNIESSSKLFSQQKTIIKLNKPQGQHHYGMCWAATAGTIINYENGSSISAFDICNKMGKTYSEGGNLYDVRSALRKYGVYYNHIVAKKLSWSTVKDIIASKSLIGIGGSAYNGNGHIVTLNGYKVENGRKYIYVWDSEANEGSGGYRWREYADGIFSYIENTAYYWERSLYC